MCAEKGLHTYEHIIRMRKNIYKVNHGQRIREEWVVHSGRKSLTGGGTLGERGGRRGAGESIGNI